MKIRTLIVIIALGFATTADAQQHEFIKGADISWLQEVEAGGGIFREQGSAKDALTVLRSHGFNYIRLRTWHSPAGGINDLAHTLTMAKRAKELGFKLLLDLHYSDWWADPGSQTIPAAWKGLTFPVLKDSVRSYTARVFAALKQQGTVPQMVQFGNEIVCGMLWNEGNVCDPYNTVVQWNKLAGLLQAARAGMKEGIGSDSVTTMIHIDAGGNYTTSSWFFDNLTNVFPGFDVIGLSYYPWWHGTIAAMKDNAERLAQRYNRDVVLAEIAYPFTLASNDNTTNIVGSAGQVMAGYPATVDGQREFLSAVLNTVRSIPSQHGRGVFYWEPDAIAAPGWGSPWENLSLFGFDGEVLPSMNAFIDSVRTEAKEIPTIPSAMVLSAYPNPFNPTATAVFTVRNDGPARLTLYNSIGQTVGTMFKGEVSGGKEYRVTLNGTGWAGGVYLLMLESGNERLSKRVVLLK